MIKGAIISDCKRYRFQLWRIWDESKPLVMWVMHNPSKADAVEDDHTITRCINYAKEWGYGGIYVGNLFPYRATDPDELNNKPIFEIAPMENMAHVRSMTFKCQLHIFAYGNPVVKGMEPDVIDDIWHYLKLTKAGNPGHPLYLSKKLTPIKFNK